MPNRDFEVFVDRKLALVTIEDTVLHLFGGVTVRTGLTHRRTLSVGFRSTPSGGCCRQYRFLLVHLRPFFWRKVTCNKQMPRLLASCRVLQKSNQVGCEARDHLRRSTRSF